MITTRILRLKDVMHLTGLGRSTIYKFIADGFFPCSVPLGGRAVGWIEEEVEDWVLARIDARDQGAQGADVLP